MSRLFSRSCSIAMASVIPALVLPTIAGAAAINSGETTGAYHSTLCPRLEAELKRSSFPHVCTTSQGTGDNLQRVLANPRQIGFGQLDILALEGALAGNPSPVTLLRRDDVRECLFAVTRVKEIATYGDLAANARKLRVILPPKDSGSAATYRYLASIDKDGLGRAANVAHAPSTDAAIRQALSADDTVTIFVQFPDPDNARFGLVRELGGHFVPIIDRAILRPQIGNDKVYFAQETQIANASWSSVGVKVVTACTPLVVFTGALEKVAGEKAQQDHKDLIATVRALRSEALVPAESGFSRFMRRTKEISAVGTEQMFKLSEDARERAKPLLERAKDVGGRALDAAKPTLDKAKDATREVLDRAKKGAKDLMDKVDPGSDPKK